MSRAFHLTRVWADSSGTTHFAEVDVPLEDVGVVLLDGEIEVGDARRAGRSSSPWFRMTTDLRKRWRGADLMQYVDA